MRLSIKKTLMLFSTLVLIMINQACGKLEDSKNSFYEETGNFVSSQKVSPTEEPLISSINNQIPQNKTIDYVIYNSDDIKYEDLNFIDENVYKAISEVNSSIDYYGTFENEDITDSESILEKYYRVVVGEETYINVDKDNENMEDDFRSINPNEYVYYQFDMDKDGFPELIVSDQQRYEYIFKYDTNNNDTMLISVIRTTSQLLGDNKISNWQSGVGLTYAYYELDNSGERKSEIRFYSASYYNNKMQQEDKVYMVGFPKDSKVIEEVWKTPHQNGKTEIYFDDLTETHYFKITEEQYNQLAKDLFESRKEAEENIKQVTYTFDELFGEFI
ncbi:MAG: hypothetical protein GX321_09685 [Clostridiales bacterium]|nr:hypothetical protein [Clostridiales bacterium]